MYLSIVAAGPLHLSRSKNFNSLLCIIFPVLMGEFQKRLILSGFYPNIPAFCNPVMPPKLVLFVSLKMILLLNIHKVSRRKLLVLVILLCIKLRKRRTNAIRAFPLCYKALGTLFTIMAMIMNLISLSQNSFNVLLTEFKKHYKFLTGLGRRGRSSKAKDHHTVLAILLHYYSSMIEY